MITIRLARIIRTLSEIFAIELAIPANETCPLDAAATQARYKHRHAVALLSSCGVTQATALQRQWHYAVALRSGITLIRYTARWAGSQMLRRCWRGNVLFRQ